MADSPELLSNIQFDEAKKGYDRDQVDNFLRELGKQVVKVQDMLIEATKRAEKAESMVADSAKSAAVAQAEAEALKAEADAARSAAADAPAKVSPENEIEQASGVLALAQKTADAAVAEAEAKAKETVADARARAAMMVVEAEQEIERIKHRASEQVDSLVASRSADAEAYVAELHREREQLQREVDELRTQLGTQRDRVRDGIAHLSALLAEGGALMNDLNEAESGPDESLADDADDDASSTNEPLDDLIDATVGDHAELEDEVVDDDDDDDDDEEDDDDDDDAAVIDDDVTMSEATAVSGDRLAEAADAFAAADSGAVSIVTVEDLEQAPNRVVDKAAAVMVSDLLEGPAPVAAAAPAEPPVVVIKAEVDDRPRLGLVPRIDDSAEAAPAAPAALIDLTGEHEAVVVDQDATQAFDVLQDNEPTPTLSVTRGESATVVPLGNGVPSITRTVDSSLGEPDAGADEAMRAFFETDLEGDRESRGRFLRRK